MADDGLPPHEFNVGDQVRKTMGYQFDGEVRAVFSTTEGLIRYVVEHATSVGMLHIFNEAQIKLRP